jgi:hypothetical protein
VEHGDGCDSEREIARLRRGLERSSNAASYNTPADDTNVDIDNVLSRRRAGDCARRGRHEAEGEGGQGPMQRQAHGSSDALAIDALNQAQQKSCRVYGRCY